MQHANLHFVTPTLAIGGDLHAKPLTAAYQLNDIDNVGITHIVDCRIEWSDEDVFATHLPHISYLHHGMDDAGQDVPAAWFDTAIGWIEAAGPDAVVLTHCHMGINRGPSLGYAVLLHQGWDAVEAIAAIRQARPQANVCFFVPDRTSSSRSPLATLTRCIFKDKLWAAMHASARLGS